MDVSRSAILSQSSRAKARKRREEEQKKRTHFAIHPLAGFITLIGLAASVATFWPHPKATVAPPVDPNDPFSSSVTVENAGLLPLLSVRFVLALRSGDFASGLSMAGPPNYSSSLCLLGSVLQDLTMDERFEFPLNKMLDAEKQDLKGADLGVIVIYQLPIIGTEMQKLFPFAAARQSDGNFYWYAHSAPPPPKFEHCYGIAKALQFYRNPSTGKMDLC